MDGKKLPRGITYRKSDGRYVGRLCITVKAM